MSILSSFMRDHLSWTIVVAGTVLFLGVFIIRSILSYRRLRHFPGPVWASISPLWLAQKTMSGTLYLNLAAVNDKYGKIARIGPNLLVTSDPMLLRRMSAARSSYTKSNWYDAVRLDPEVDNVVSQRNDKAHTEMRARLASGYAGKENPNFEASIDERVMDLVNLIERSYLSTNGTYKVMDFARLAQFFTIDVLTDVAFSRSFGYLKANSDLHDYIKTACQYIPILEMQANIPFVNTILGNTYIRKLMAPTESDIFGMGKMMGIAKEVADERFGPNAKVQTDMLGSFVKHGLDQKESASEALLQIMVGTDSTATAVRTTLYFILTNPRVHATLVRELDGASLHRPVLRDAEARQLPYLQACIREGLRTHPPVCSTMNKQSSPEGDMLDDGTYIPGGVQIAYNAWGTHHDKRLYGPDADVFRPERWLEAGGEKKEAMTRSMELVFGFGKYSCLGKLIASLELNKVFAELFLRFDFSVIDPQKGFLSSCNGFFIQSNMNLIATPRTIRH